jgi:FkbH-like protein
MDIKEIIKNLKLIVWDLDDTFWHGTISESAIVPVERNIQLIKDLTDCGIVNSICSKNDYKVAAAKLQELGVSDYFVFSSINWESKAQRIKNQIDSMALRPANTLFIDDNDFNLREAQHFSPDLMTAAPEIIDELSKYFSVAEKTDLKHKRLQQYKLLEQKNKEETKFDSNEEFLFASNIRVEIHKDCEKELPRLHEMILRTNQLNFTKKRISENELCEIIKSTDYQCGYVTVTDKFGNYGIVGFFALKNKKLEHFLFSCRTMGQGIEQYVYAQLEFPDIQIVGEVRNQLVKDYCPSYINQNTTENNRETSEIENVKLYKIKILVKGPCDISKSLTYIKNQELFTTEFTYINSVKYNIIDTYNHSIHILGLKEYGEIQKKMLIEECIFVDENMLEGTFFTENYDIIFLSTIIESVYGIYRNKNTDIQVVFGDYKYPLTDKNNWKKYISGEIYNGQNAFTEEYLTQFTENYEFIGKTTPEDFIVRITKILKYLPTKTTLCLILGAEFPLDKPPNEYCEHILLNNAVKELAKTENQLKYIEIAKIATTKHDFTDTINHFTTRVYYEIAKEMQKIIRQKTNEEIKNYPLVMIYFDSFINSIKQNIKKMLSPDSQIYNTLKKAYLKISRKKNNVK